MTSTLRSAVSIARRLQDPLAELVKIDPKAVGVGQYQHDMPQTAPGMTTLDGVVESCVNERRRGSGHGLRVAADARVAGISAAHRRTISSPGARRTARSPPARS